MLCRDKLRHKIWGGHEMSGTNAVGDGLARPLHIFARPAKIYCPNTEKILEEEIKKALGEACLSQCFFAIKSPRHVV